MITILKKTELLGNYWLFSSLFQKTAATTPAFLSIFVSQMAAVASILSAASAPSRTDPSTMIKDGYDRREKLLSLTVLARKEEDVKGERDEKEKSATTASENDHEDDKEEDDESWKDDWKRAHSVVMLRHLTIEALQDRRGRTPVTRSRTAAAEAGDIATELCSKPV